MKTVSRKKEEVNVLSIDLNRLEEELEKQARVFGRWAERLAKAKSEVRDAKAELAVTKAELSMAIRSKPDRFKLKKVTDPAVADCIILQPEHKAALKDLNNSLHYEDFVQGKVNALEQKKRMMEKLVDLHGQQYWSKPRTGPARDMIRKHREREDED
jgi:hypothetical protein